MRYPNEYSVEVSKGWHGMESEGKAKKGVAWKGKENHVKAWHGMTREGNARHGMA